MSASLQADTETPRRFSVLKSLGGCGGTIISRALAANGAFVLSEVNPRAAQLFAGGLNPLVQVLHNHPSLLPDGWACVDVHTLGAPPIFGKFMSDFQDQLQAPLLIRDYSFVDYVGTPFIWPRPEKACLDVALEPFGRVDSVVLLRHPAAAFRSLLRQPPLAGVLQPAEFVAGHLAFLRAHPGTPKIRFESFLESPDRVVAELCALLNLPHRPDWRDRLEAAPQLTGNDKAKQAKHILPPVLQTGGGSSDIERSEGYEELLQLAGYHADQPAPGSA